MKRVLGVLLLVALAGEAARTVQAAPAPPPARKRAVPSPAPVVDEGPLEAVIETAQGSFTIRLLSDLAP
ncbi:MAG TPA: hypothetical protein VGQ33_08860, partial [Vicinamibacteria bacterium]|nr:hypothetical protein [Vicinamibacteria bacterium]